MFEEEPGVFPHSLLGTFYTFLNDANELDNSGLENSILQVVTRLYTMQGNIILKQM